MKKILTEKTSAELRNTIKSYGHSEKGNELTSGGELNSNFVQILIYLIQSWAKISNCPLKFTAGNDNFHKKRKNSLHKSGNAIDVTLAENCRSKFSELLKKFGGYYNGFSHIDEYKTPSKGSTKGHFHISYSKGSPESNNPVTEPLDGTTGGTETDIQTQTDNNPILKGMLNSLGYKDDVNLKEQLNRIKKLML